VDQEKITLILEGGSMKVSLVEGGRIMDGFLERAKEIMRGRELLFHVDLGLGAASARSFGCDLTHEYVDINASYTT
jgi:glutamate N-acetyltransferase/amino-acid N-acetyltransferase